MSCGERASEAHRVSQEGSRSVWTRESWQGQVQGRPLRRASERASERSSLEVRAWSGELRRASERAKLTGGAWVSRDDEGVQAGADSGEATLGGRETSEGQRVLGQEQRRHLKVFCLLINSEPALKSFFKS